MWEWAWESTCPKEWGCRKKAQDLSQSYKINGSINGFENGYIASFKVKFYNCEKRIGWFDSGVEKLAAQNVASQGPVHDCTFTFIHEISIRGPLREQCYRIRKSVFQLTWFDIQQFHKTLAVRTFQLFFCEGPQERKGWRRPISQHSSTNERFVLVGGGQPAWLGTFVPSPRRSSVGLYRPLATPSWG